MNEKGKKKEGEGGGKGKEGGKKGPGNPIQCKRESSMIYPILFFHCIPISIASPHGGMYLICPAFTSQCVVLSDGNAELPLEGTLSLILVL